MSRLEYYQKKQLTKTIFFIIVFLILIIVFIFTIGFKLILNSSLFFSHFFNKNADVNNTFNKTTDMIGQVDITDIPSATNSSSVILSGTILNLETLEFFLNDEKVKTLSTSGRDSFAEEINTLKKGDNIIYILGKNKYFKKEKQTQKYHVLLKNEKPKLEIQEPKDNLTVNKFEITINGRTDKEVFIKINNAPIVVNADGNFQTNIKLQEGENKISIIAQDIANNIEEKILIITYKKED